MESANSTVESALLEVAKELIQASDEIAQTDPPMAAKLRQEAYEIARDLAIVQGQVARDRATVPAHPDLSPQAAPAPRGLLYVEDDDTLQLTEDDSDILLNRLLDRQRELVPSRARAFDRHERRPWRERWLAWMRNREAEAAE